MKEKRNKRLKDKKLTSRRTEKLEEEIKEEDSFTINK
jgi:hypothetical protein